MTSILVVDDDPGFREAAAELLRVKGFAVVGYARNADEAIAALRQSHPDAVLLDVRLPGRDGLCLARQLATWANHPVVLLTSSDARAVNHSTAMECGAVGFVAKAELATTDLGPYLRS